MSLMKLTQFHCPKIHLSTKHSSFCDTLKQSNIFSFSNFFDRIMNLWCCFSKFCWALADSAKRSQQSIAGHWRWLDLLCKRTHDKTWVYFHIVVRSKNVPSHARDSYTNNTCKRCVRTHHNSQPIEARTKARRPSMLWVRTPDSSLVHWYAIRH